MYAYHLDATGFATLSALAMYAYSLMQIPVGIFADLYGARRCILISILVCSAGTLLFCSTSILWVAQISRILIGVGSACAFLCVSKIAVNWFGSERHAQLFGLTMMAGTIGALNGGAPLAYSLNFFSWRETLFILGCIGLVLWVLNYFFLQDHPQKTTQTKHNFKSLMHEALRSIRSLVSQPQCWISATVALGIYSCVSVLADLWGVSFCMQAYGLDRTDAAQVTSMIYVGLCCGSVLIPFISHRIFGSKFFILMGLSSIAICFALFIYGPHVSAYQASLLCFLIGFFAGAEMLCFANACRVLPQDMAGTVTGFVNGVVMLGGSCLQQLVGYTLDQLWDGTMTEQGIRVYSVFAYQSAFYLLGSCILGALVVALFLKPQKQNVPALSTI
jgi:sugar phosphate permease